MTSWPTPTDEQISQVSRLTVRSEEERYFFANLENPRWIDALHRQGALKPPAPVLLDEGAVSYPRWPFSAYLVRVAANHPNHEQVLAVIEEFADTENPNIRVDLMRALARLDPCIIGKMLPQVANWLSNQTAALVTWDLTGELAVQAMKCPEHAADVRQILVAQFRPRPAETGNVFQHHSALEWWETKEFARRFLPSMVELDWRLTVATFLDLIDRLIEQHVGDRSFGAAGRYDFTDWWLPVASEDDKSWDRGEPLAYLAAHCLDAVALLSETPVESVLTLLDHGDSIVHRRLRLHYLSRRAAHAGVVGEMGDALADPMYASNHPPAPEYDALLKAVIERGSGEERGATIKSIAMIADEAGDVSDYWFFGRLAVISDLLPEEWQERFRDLVAEFGPPPEREPRVSFRWERPEERSPLTADEAESMTAAELASFASEWTQPERDFAFELPTWKGLAAELEREAKNRPNEFSQAAASFSEVDRTVIGGLFRGLSEAVRDGKSIDWETTLGLIRSVATHPEANDEEWESRFGRDVSWSEAKREALNLLETGLRAEQSLSLELSSSVWETIEILAEHGEGVLHTPLDDVHDSVFAALNASRSQAVYAAVTYLLWLRRSGSADLPEQTQAFFKRMLDPSLEPFIGMRAAAAHKLPQLAYVEEAWLIRLLPEMFPPVATHPTHWLAAWDAYVRHSSPMLPPAVLAEMAPFYRTAAMLVDEDHQVSGPEDRTVMLGIHLVAMYLRGDIGLDHSSLLAFYQRAPVSVRSGVYGWIGRIAGHEDLTEDWYDRVQRFVEWRERQLGGDENEGAELRMLGWLVASGRFPAEWWAPRLGHALRQSRSSVGVYIPLEHMMEQVAAASDIYPGDALSVLEHVFAEDRDGYYRPYLPSAIQIVSTALQWPELSDRAREIADQFARAGHDEFERLAAARPRLPAS
ncbi:MAG: hypothetical protein OXT70_03480 [Chloroflexota bacterium]|nr:hypothetical protein [Chloroflexota bacterium]